MSVKKCPFLNDQMNLERKVEWRVYGHRIKLCMCRVCTTDNKLEFGLYFFINTIIQIFTKCPFLNIYLTVHQSWLKCRVFCVSLVYVPWCIRLLCVCTFVLHLEKQFWSYMFLAENHKIQNGRHFMGENDFFFFFFSSEFSKLIYCFQNKFKKCPLMNVKYVMKCHFLNKMIFTFRNTMIQYTSTLYCRYSHI